MESYAQQLLSPLASTMYVLHFYAYLFPLSQVLSFVCMLVIYNEMNIIF